MINGRFTLNDIIGRGGMGTVYRGHDNQTGQLVAVKHLNPEIVADDPDQVERFRREGEALRQLNHPNIVKMLTAVVEDGEHYLIMEYVSGGSLRDLLDARPQLPIKQVLEIGLDLADALTRAHRLDIIHRDIKPGNVLLAEDNTPRLTDFGVAYLGRQDRITQAGSLTGTYAYLCPESLHGETPDSRADIWSFGVLLYEMVAGRLPFVERQIAALIMAITGHETPRLATFRPHVLPELEALIAAMLVKDPDQRISSVRLVGAELEAILHQLTTGHSTGTGSERVVHTDREAGPSRFTPSTDGRSLAFSETTPRHNLPVQATPFVGRQSEIDEIVARISQPDCRLLTLMGAGGMGKTRLSLEVAGRKSGDFADGAFFIPLAPLNSPDSIPGIIADAVRFSFYGQEDPWRQLLNYLREKEMLLVLDNFEHLTAGADYVMDMLSQAPRIKILVTSRENLNLREEWLYAVQGMRFPDGDEIDELDKYSAVRLFLERAQQVKPGFSLADEQVHVIHICRLVDGLPLGIELAAAWLKMLSCAEIIQEIESGIDFLETSARNVTERHRSIRAVFDYSWNLLSEREREGLSKLSIFRGGFRRQAATAVTGASLLTLSTLVDKSLLRRNRDGRYELHELLRQYAAERLDGTASDEAHGRHAAYYTSFLQQRENELKAGRQLEALAEIKADLENIRLAWQWVIDAGDGTAVDLAMEALRLFYDIHGRFREGQEAFRPAVAAFQDATPGDGAAYITLAKLQVRYAIFCEGVSLFEESRKLLQESLAVFRAQNVQTEIALCLYQQAYVSYKSDRMAGAKELLQESLAVYQSLDDLWGVSRCFTVLALILAETDAKVSNSYFNKSLAICRQIHDQWGVARALMNLGAVDDNLPQGLELLEEALAFYKKIANRFLQAHILQHMARLHTLMGNYDEAKLHCKRSERLCREVGQLWARYPSLLRRMTVARLTGDYETVGLLGAELLRLGQHVERLQWTVTLWDNLALTAYVQGNRDEANQNFYHLLEIVQKSDGQGLFFTAVGFLACDLEIYEAAAQCFQESLARAEQHSNSLQAAGAYRGMGRLAQLQGDCATAVAHHQKSMALYHEVGEEPPLGMFFTHFFMGQAHQQAGDYDAAQEQFGRALAIAQETGRAPRALDILLEVAGLLAQTGDIEQAATLLAFIERHPAAEKETVDKAVERQKGLVAALPAETMTAVRQKSAEMQLEKVVKEFLLI